MASARHFTRFASYVFFVSASAAASAVPLSTGGLVSLTGTTVVDRPELAGANLVDNIVPFDLGGLHGNLQVRVVKETNSGTLDFYYGIRDLVGTPAAEQVVFANHDGFENWSTDVDFRTDGLGSVGPTYATRTGGPLPAALQFYFINPVGLEDVMPNDPLASRFWFIKTDATAYSASSTLLTTLGPSGASYVTLPTFAPVPAPPAIWLLASALAALTFKFKRQSSASSCT